MQSKGIFRGIYYTIILILTALTIISIAWLGLNVLTATGGVSLTVANFNDQVFVYVGIALIACLLLQIIFVLVQADAFAGILLLVITFGLIFFGAYSWPINKSAFLICIAPAILFGLLITGVLKKGR